MRLQRRQRTSATSRDRGHSHRCACLTITGLAATRGFASAQPGSPGSAAGLQARIEGVDERPVPWILPARSHLPGDVPDRDAGLGIAAANRATGPEVPECPVSAADRSLWLGELEAEAEPRRAVQDQVIAAHLLGDCVGERAAV